MSPESRKLAGILLIVFPTVIYGSITLLTLLVHDPRYMQNPLRQNLWRAGHAHVGILLVLSLIALRYVDEARLSARLKGFIRSAIPTTAILLPVAFFSRLHLPMLRSQIPAIVFTPHISNSAQPLMTVGFQGHLQKPISPDRLVAVIEEITHAGPMATNRTA